MGSGRLWTLLSVALGLLWMMACAQATPTSPPATAAPTPTATPLPTPSATPVVLPVPQGRVGGTLTVAGASSIPHRDVHQAVQESLTTLGPGLAYSRLLRLRSGEGLEQPHLLLECDLCESWRLNDDLVYEFTLRPDIRWQNVAPVQGRRLTADDLAFSYERLRTPGWANAPLLASIGAIRSVDDRTLEVELAVADADAILSLADGHAKVVAQEVVEQYGDLREAPVAGTGPWVWQESASDGGFRFLRNSDYFEPGLPFLDELVVLTAPSDQSDGARAAYAAGLADVISAGPGDSGTLPENGHAFESTVSKGSGAGLLLALNAGRPPLDSTLIRRAIFRAIDPWDYLDTIWGGVSTAETGVGIPVRSAAWLLDREELRRDYFADPVAARQIMAATRTTLPVRIEVAVQTSRDGKPGVALEERLVSDLRSVGFEPILRRMTPDQFQQHVIGPEKDFQLAVGDAPPAHTTNGFLFPLLHSQGRWNVASLEDDKLDGLIEEQAAQFDKVVRQAHLLEIQRHILERAYLFSPRTALSGWLHTRDLKGFAPNDTLSEYNYWSRTWLER